MSQSFRLENVGLINREKKYHSNLMVKFIMVMKGTP